MNLEARLTRLLAARLGCAITWAHWHRDPRTGADYPVWHVPADHHHRAADLGFHAWQFVQ